MSAFTIIAVVLFVGALVFVHEMGHFAVAKLFHIKVTKFSLGFGPPLVAFTRGETTYQIAAVPLGGYVRMVGESPGEAIAPEDRARAFTSAPLHQRALVALAGPAANLVFPVLCFFAYNLLEPEVHPPVIGEVEPGDPADRAGFRPGDRVLFVGDDRAWSFQRLVQLVSARPGEEITVRFLRDGQELELQVTPKSVADEDVFGQPRQKGMISVSAVRDGTSVGIEDPSRNPVQGLRTGDRVLSVDGVPVRLAEDLDEAFARAAGRTVPVVVARAEPMEAGDLVHAEAPRRLTLTAKVPPGVRGLGDMGLARGSPFVRSVVPGGAAARAGVRPGDRIVSVEGRPVEHFWRFLAELEGTEGRPVAVGVRRGGVTSTVRFALEPVECVHPHTRKSRVMYDHGFGRGPTPHAGMECSALARPAMDWGTLAESDLERAHLSIDEALMESLRLTGQVIGLLTTHLFKMLVTQEVSTDTVGGPLQFVNVAAKAAEAGILAYLQMLAFISINLGVFNLLPVPVLDGGHLLFCLIEAVKRKPLSPEARERAAMVGLAVLAMLLLLALRNDLRSLEIF